MLGFLSFVFSTFAWACPLCHSNRAATVREGILTQGAQPSLWLGLTLPFVAAGLMAYWGQTGEKQRGKKGSFN